MISLTVSGFCRRCPFQAHPLHSTMPFTEGTQSEYGRTFSAEPEAQINKMDGWPEFLQMAQMAVQLEPRELRERLLKEVDDRHKERCEVCVFSDPTK
jgi:hypothetical protein